MIAEKTYWNGEPCEARRVLVIVGQSSEDTPPLSWYRGLEGTERRAVEVTYGGEVFYLDDDDGWGLTPEDNERILATLPEDEQRKIRGLREVLKYEPREPRAGDGWRKVTIGYGSPGWGHRSLPVERVVGELIDDG